jgi:hypothetical protein
MNRYQFNYKVAKRIKIEIFYNKGENHPKKLNQVRL